jgi:hypothetical protein
MIVMQTIDALAQRSRIESKRLAKVIYSHELDDSVCIQYHPKGIKGGMMPELDSHHTTPSNPQPLIDRFSPWHACGPKALHPTYSDIMKKHADLHLVGAVLRLAPGDSATEAASRQWEDIFGVPRSRDLLAFTNARLGFIRGEAGQPEGLVSITIAIEGRTRFDSILERAREEGLCGDGWVNMCGIKWYFVQKGESRMSNL